MSKYDNFRKAKAIEKQNKERLLKINTSLTENSGIYVLTRVDENGIKYAYVGQAKHLLTRLAQHLVGYQHIDLSLKKHGFFTEGNVFGWCLAILEVNESKLDEYEQHYIKVYANRGYQLRNKTAGGQGEGKKQIDEYRPSKGYRDGVLQGKKTLAKELSHIIEKHLEIGLKQGKENNKISINALEKFRSLLDEKNYESGVE